MKRVCFVFVAVFLLFAGCRGKATPIVGEPSPVSAVSPTVTPSPNATQVYQSTLQANQTQNAGMAMTQGVRLTEGAQTRAVEALTPTLTPTIFPSPTVTPSPTLFELPLAPKLDANAYGLTFPAPETLVQLDLLNSLPENDEALWNQGDLRTGAFSDVLAFEWGRTFPHHLEQVNQLSALIRNEDQNYGMYLSPQIQEDILSEYYFRYFNENHIVFADREYVSEDRVSWQAFWVETDHDRSPEWLVQVEVNYDFHASFWLTLDQNPAGTYTRLPNAFFAQTGYFPWPPLVEYIGDLTGDGLSDVILLDFSSGFGNRYHYTFFDVAISTPNGFETISNFYETEDAFSTILTLSYEVDTSGQIPRFHIIHVHELPWGCQYETYKDYQWLGGNETVISSNSSEADTVACYLARAVEAQNPPENREAIQWLNYAYSEGEFAPEDQTFILYKLALLYTLEGEPGAAKNYLNAIIELADNNAHPTTVALAQQLQPLLEQNQILPYKLCQAAEAIALPNPFSDGYNYVPTAYPYEGLEDGYPAPLCDTQDIQLDVLNALQFNAKTSPENGLREAGFAVQTVLQVPPSFPGNTWLALVEDDSPDNWRGDDWNANHYIYLLRYIEHEGWDLITFFDHPDYLDWVNQDFTGDGIPEIGIVYKYNNPKYTPCDLAEEQYLVYTLSRLAENWNVLSSDNQICLPMNIPFAFEDVLQDKNGDGMVDRVVNQLEAENYDVSLLETISPTRTLATHMDLYESDLVPLISKTAILSDLTTRFFASPTLLRPELESYRTRWGMDDNPTSHQIYAHLTYLLALTYELEGDEPQAVAYFYDVWANYPDTLWAYLAASRLALKTSP